jgi:hypothetical protein
MVAADVAEPDAWKSSSKRRGANGVISEADLIANEAREPEANGHVLRRLAHRGPSNEERRYGRHVVCTAMTSRALTLTGITR